MKILPRLCLLLALLGVSLQACEPKEAPEAALSVWFTRPGESPPERVDTALCHWLDQARSSLDMAAFELDLPCVVTSLSQAKARGVKVRLVIDSENESPELAAIRAAGVPIVGDQRSALMHNKFIVRDQQAVWTGSLNFTVSGVERNHNNALAFLSPGMARLYQAEFEEMFIDHQFGPRSPRQQLPQLFTQPIQAEVLFAPEDPVRSRLLDVLKNARQSIRFLAFSFTDDEIGKLVLAQARKGVAVQGVFETTGSGTKYSEYGPFKAAGLDVRRDGDTKVILHHKLFIIDDKIVVTGSYNFSRNADKSNDENLLILSDADLARRYSEEFRRLYAQSQ
jgi:phosphatidylserine/phosphatidylglycerophosphate/cardiolipin synthase-like enzyme